MSQSDPRDELSYFRRLRERPTPELDSRGLWALIASGLAPRDGRLRSRAATVLGVRALSPRGWALLGSGLAVAMVAIVLAVGPGQGPPDASDSEDTSASTADLPSVPASPGRVGEREPTGLVWLRPTSPEAPAAGPAAGSVEGEGLRVRVRLVRGYEGTPPPDVGAAQQLGSGGADVIGDVRDDIAALLPFRQFGLVAEWEGLATPAPVSRVRLGDGYELQFAPALANTAGGARFLELRDLRFAGTGVEFSAARLRLIPGQPPYLLGALEEGASLPSLILVIEATAAESGTGESR